MDATLSEMLGGSFALSPAAQRITLRQLATHTSGFPSEPQPLVQKVTRLAGTGNLLLNPYSHLVPNDVFDYLKTTPDMGKPGRFEYSNFGMGLRGHVLEIVTKRDLESLIAEKVLVPLGMTSTAITPTPAMKEYLIPGYSADGSPSPLWTFGALAGAGSLSSSATDMLKFPSASVDSTSKLSQSLGRTHAPQFSGDSGIGWMQPRFLDRVFGNRDVVWHNGMVGGYASYISVDAVAKTGVIVLSSRAVDVTMLGMMLTRQARVQTWSDQHQP